MAESETRWNARGFLKSGRTLFKLGKREERQISPLVEGNSGDIKHVETTNRNNMEERRAQRDDKKMKKEEAKRIQDIDFQSKILKRSLRREVKQDLARTSSETLVTFCFIFTIGTFLFGGGTALIVSGRENNIFDFIVVGSSGIVIGVIFTVTGIVLMFKPVYANYQRRKQESEENANFQHPELSNMPCYLDDAKKATLTAQLVDTGRRSRRPSNVELYGDAPPGHQGSGPHAVIVPDPRNKKDPPPVAIPNIANTKNITTITQEDPVFFLDPKDELGRTQGSLGSPLKRDMKNGSDVAMVSIYNSVSGIDVPIDVLIHHETKADLDIGGEESQVRVDSGMDGSDKSIATPVLHDREQSDSPPIVVTHNNQQNKMAEYDEVAPKDGSSSTETKREDIRSMASNSVTPTIVVVDGTLSREQSAITKHRLQSIQTPSSVILTYDKDTFETNV